MAFAETANLAVKLTLGGNFTSQLAKANRSLKAFDKDATRAFKAGSQIGTGIKRGALLAGAGLSALAVGIAKSVDAAGDFEAQLNTINTIARTSPQLLGKIGDSIRGIAKDTGTSLDDLTQGYYDLLSAGIKTADAQNVLAQSNKLAIGGLSTTAEAVDLLTTAINVYGGDARKAGAYTDLFAKAIERGKVTAAELSSSFAIVGPVAAASGIEIQELAAGYARLTAVGIPAAEAATDMRSAIIALTRTTKPLEALQEATGKNYLKIAGKKGLVEALNQLRTDGKKAGVPLIELLGRVEGLNFTLATTGGNFDAYNADLAAMGDSAGTAAAQMAERQKGLNFQLARLKALAKDAGITIGTALLPKLTPVVAALNDFINSNQSGIAAFGDQLAGAFTPEGIISGIKGITSALLPMIDLIKVAAAPVKAITQAFLSLPKEVQTVLVGAFAVNKLTGGLVTNIGGGIIESIGKSLLGGIKAPLVNVSGGVVTVNGAAGGLPGVGGIPGGAAGAAAGLGTAAAVGIGGAALGAGLIAAVNSPLWVKSGALNDQLQSKGLTQAERAAQHYYTANARDQAEIRKHISNLPTIADFNSGNAKLFKGMTDTAYKAQQTAAAVKDADSTINVKGNANVSAQQRGASSIVGAERSGSGAIVAAVRSIPAPVTNVTTNVSLTAGGLTKTVTVTKRYGPVGGSRVVDDGVRER